MDRLSQNLAGYVRQHTPFGDPLTLSAQDALDIAAYINDRPRPDGMADEMFCHTETDGIPASLRKPASWLVGCTYPERALHGGGHPLRPLAPHHRVAQRREQPPQVAQLTEAELTRPDFRSG